MILHGCLGSTDGTIPCYNGDPAVGIAQLAEHRTVAPAVAGSIPVSHPIRSTRIAISIQTRMVPLILLLNYRVASESLESQKPWATIYRLQTIACLRGRKRSRSKPLPPDVDRKLPAVP